MERDGFSAPNLDGVSICAKRSCEKEDGHDWLDLDDVLLSKRGKSSSKMAIDYPLSATTGDKVEFSSLSFHLGTTTTFEHVD